MLRGQGDLYIAPSGVIAFSIVFSLEFRVQGSGFRVQGSGFRV